MTHSQDRAADHLEIAAARRKPEAITQISRQQAVSSLQQSIGNRGVGALLRAGAGTERPGPPRHRRPGPTLARVATIRRIIGGAVVSGMGASVSARRPQATQAGVPRAGDLSLRAGTLVLTGTAGEVRKWLVLRGNDYLIGASLDVLEAQGEQEADSYPVYVNVKFSELRPRDTARDRTLDPAGHAATNLTKALIGGAVGNYEHVGVLASVADAAEMKRRGKSEESAEELIFDVAFNSCAKGEAFATQPRGSKGSAPVGGVLIGALRGYVSDRISQLERGHHTANTPAGKALAKGRAEQKKRRGT